MKTILVVDDEPRIRQLYRDTFEEEGYRVLDADGAEAALKLLEDSPVDLAILDIRMPGIHGLELLTRLHTLCPELPVILCSGLRKLFDDYAVWAASGQVVGMFEKPVDACTLLRRVSEVLGTPSPSA